MSHGRIGFVAALGLVLASCQTITEDLPVTTSSAPSSASVPLIVLQIPQPTVQTPPPSSPTAVPGSSPSSGQQQPQPTGQPQPTNPPASSGGGNCDGFPPNCNPVASVHAYVYFIMCNGVAMPDTKFAESGPVDCDVRLDA